jgi:hypothetical protein
MSKLQRSSSKHTTVQNGRKRGFFMRAERLGQGAQSWIREHSQLVVLGQHLSAINQLTTLSRNTLLARVDLADGGRHDRSDLAEDCADAGGNAGQTPLARSGSSPAKCSFTHHADLAQGIADKQDYDELDKPTDSAPTMLFCTCTSSPRARTSSAKSTSGLPLQTTSTSRLSSGRGPAVIVMIAPAGMVTARRFPSCCATPSVSLFNRKCFPVSIRSSESDRLSRS